MGASELAQPVSARAARASRLLADSAARGVPLRALGGAAVELLCPSAQPGGRWSRPLADIDVATIGKARRDLDVVVRDNGFRPDEHFNRMNGSVRMRYFDQDDSHLDVFVDELRLCHVVNWRKTLELATTTLPLPELLLTKLQVVQAEAKDLSDLSALLTDQWGAVRDQISRLEGLVAGDWGLWRTGKGTLEQLDASEDPEVASRAADLLARWQDFKLTAKARLRATVGERVRWYEEPEEV